MCVCARALVDETTPTAAGSRGCDGTHLHFFPFFSPPSFLFHFFFYFSFFNFFISSPIQERAAVATKNTRLFFAVRDPCIAKLRYLAATPDA